MIDRISIARTFLFVPGLQPERFEKAARSGADVVVLDLEDSVPAADKGLARTAIEREWLTLRKLGVPVMVRMNSPETTAADEDIAFLSNLPNLDAVMVPKAESAQSLHRLREQLGGARLLPMIETAAGYAGLLFLAAVPGIVRLVIGHLDFIADVGFESDPEQTQLTPLRFAVAMATRVNRLSPAVDGVTVEIGDDERLAADVVGSLRFGFTGKLCIHPRQIDVVHRALIPSQGDLEWARKVLAASLAAKGGAVQVDGRMVDAPVVLQANRLLARAPAYR